MTKLPPTSPLNPAVATAAAWISSRWSTIPKVGIILGTGAGQVAEAMELEKRFPYGNIPHFPVSTAVGHAGNLCCGRLAGVPVVALQGRFHLYEGYNWETATFGVQVLAALGIERLLISNAAGGINPMFASGEIMLITSHWDLMFRRAQPSNGWNFQRQVQVRSDAIYDARLQAAAIACARGHNFPLHRGVYVGMLGPNYETRAEYRWLRRCGGDTVGMSTIPEVCVARDLGLPVAAFSIVSNVADPDNLVPTSGSEVVKFADVAAPHLKLLMEELTRLP